MMITKDDIAPRGDDTVEDDLGSISSDDGVVYWLDFVGQSIPASKIAIVRAEIQAILRKHNLRQ